MLKELKLLPINKSDPIYINYKNKLGTDEAIFFTYEDIKKHQKMIIISSFILVISLIIFISLNIANLRYASIFFFLLFVFSPVFCCLSSVCLCSGLRTKYKIGDLNYIFTDKKIIVDFRTGFCEIFYHNISSIIQKSTVRGNYVIEINLMKPIENNPFVPKRGRFCSY